MMHKDSVSSLAMRCFWLLNTKYGGIRQECKIRDLSIEV